MKSIFFRIDDIGDSRGDMAGLKAITEMFTKYRIAFNLQVIPAQISAATADYIRELQNKYPDLIEIDQHGYSHNLTEFSSSSSLDAQYDLLQKGSDIIADIFGTRPVTFTPPEHIYTEETIQALSRAGFGCFSKHIRSSFPSACFYYMGQRLGVNAIAGKKVSYHMQYMPGTAITELSINIESIWPGGRVKQVEEFSREFSLKSVYTPICGVLLHPVHFASPESRQNLRKILIYISHTRIPCLRFNDILTGLYLSQKSRPAADRTC